METSPSPHNPVAFLLALLWFSWTETIDPCSNEDYVNFYQDLGKELINIPMVWFSSHMLLRLHVTKIHPAKKYFPRKAWEDPQNQAPQRPAGTLWEGQSHMTHKYTYIYTDLFFPGLRDPVGIPLDFLWLLTAGPSTGTQAEVNQGHF